MTRQRLYRTPAVILKRMDLGEADRIVTLYSRDVGKIRAVAKGVRRTTSRSAGHLEPFTLSDVMFAVGRELDVISQADTLESFRQVREDLVLTMERLYANEKNKHRAWGDGTKLMEMQNPKKGLIAPANSPQPTANSTATAAASTLGPAASAVRRW